MGASFCRHKKEDFQDDEDQNEAPVFVKWPLKLIIAGAPASGKSTQCEFIKEKYGVVHLCTGDMVRAAVAAQSDFGKLAEKFMKDGKLVPDDVIIGAVKDRLNEDDCKTNGWILNGFPRTPAQADALFEAGINADCFFFLDVPDEMVMERALGRRIDPKTGKIYHMTFSPPEDDKVKARLIERNDDKEETVKTRLKQFRTNVNLVKGKFFDVVSVIDGTLKPNKVAAAIDKVCLSKIPDSTV